MTIIPVVLSGGSGTRLWPLSRADFPKQLISLISQHSMLQDTVKRLDGLNAIAPIVVCNEKHRFIIAQQLNQIGIDHASIILEPCGRNTAPAIAAACFKAIETDKDAVVVVLPSDHEIKNRERFVHAVKLAAEEALSGSLVTFGICPLFPTTGYGYIEAEKSSEKALKIRRFVEKPDKETAEKYVASGNYFWNSGMFVFRASSFLDELKEFNPDILHKTSDSMKKAVVDIDFIRLDKEEFALNPNISIDYAVMEKTSRGKVIPLDAGWSDVGSWKYLWDVSGKDADGNVIKGKVTAHGLRNSLVYSSGRTVAAVGLKDMVIVDTKDALLVASMDKSEDVKLIVEQLKNAGNSVAVEGKTGYRPWGLYNILEEGKSYKIKHIIVNPGEKLSQQLHHHRSEHWVVVSGTAKVQNGDKEFILCKNQSTYIPKETKHFLENPGRIPLEIIEIQSGDYLGEDDIVRFQDRYGRC